MKHILPNDAMNINLYSGKILIDFALYAKYFKEANDYRKYYEDKIHKNKIEIETNQILQDDTMICKF